MESAGYSLGSTPLTRRSPKSHTLLLPRIHARGRHTCRGHRAHLGRSYRALSLHLAVSPSTARPRLLSDLSSRERLRRICLPSTMYQSILGNPSGASPFRTRGNPSLDGAGTSQRHEERFGSHLREWHRSSSILLLGFLSRIHHPSLQTAAAVWGGGGLSFDGNSIPSEACYSGGP